MDLGDLLNTLTPGKDGKIGEESVCMALNNLKEKHLIYFSVDYRSIVSIIDIDQIDGVPLSGIEFK